MGFPSPPTRPSAMNTDSFDVRGWLYYVNTPYWEPGQNVSHGWIGIQCIYCSDQHNHLGINLGYMNYSCWLCGAKGGIAQLVMDVEGIDFHKARDRIDEFQELYPSDISIKEHLEDLGADQDILPEGHSNDLTQGQVEYLRSRGFSPWELVTTWGIRTAPIFGRWAYRIIIPVALGGKPMSFIGLDHTGSQKIKYKAASTEESIVPTSRLIYGWDQIPRGSFGIAQPKSVLITEGVTDCWRMGVGTVATMGMGVSTAQINGLLVLNAKRYFIMFDGEPMAIAMAHKLGQALRMGGKNVEVIELGSGDPAELPDSEVDAIRQELAL